MPKTRHGWMRIWGKALCDGNGFARARLPPWVGSYGKAAYPARRKTEMRFGPEKLFAEPQGCIAYGVFSNLAG